MTRTPSRTRRAAAAVLLAGALAGVSACGGTSVLNLEVGQCISGQTAGEDDVSSVPVVDCAEPHTGEIYSLPQVPDGEFPGEEALNQTAQELCAGPDFTTYVGVEYLQSEIYFSTLVPSADTWDDGDREIVCILLADQNGSETTGSLRGANR
ncbi:MAG: septum formation family protein [Pseudonocardiales bacterium]|nr:septum formation family protein [Pseudonocardiales bacterium]